MEMIFKSEQLDTAAADFVSNIKSSKVFLFNGDMGAGKTTFITAICRHLGVKGNVSSPTFSIINEYMSENDQVIYHIDLYRIKSEAEASHAGVEDCVYSGNLCFIEWPQKAAGLLPDNSVSCLLSVMPDNSRKLQINM